MLVILIWSVLVSELMLLNPGEVISGILSIGKEAMPVSCAAFIPAPGGLRRTTLRK